MIGWFNIPYQNKPNQKVIFVVATVCLELWNWWNI